MGKDSGNPSWFDLAGAVWSRRKWLAVGVFTLVCAATVSGARFLPNLYQSTATVLIERHQVPETFVRPSVTGELETRLQTVSQEILSRSRLAALIDRFDLYPDLRRRVSLEAIIERMRRDIQLHLEGVEQTSGRAATIAFTLSYVGRDPQTVARVTNTLASFYIEEDMKVRERQATGTAEFLRTQLQAIQKRLDEQEQRVGDFKARHIGELPLQVTANLATLERLNAQLRLNNDSQSRGMERRETLLKQLAETGSPGPDATTARIARLTLELTELRTRFSEKYPDVIRLRTEIAALERQLAETKSRGSRDDGETSPRVRIGEPLATVEADLQRLQSEEKDLRDTITTYQRRIDNAPKREQELEELSRDYGATKELYYSLSKRYEEAQLAESMEQRQRGERFRILDPAIASREPVAPNRLHLMLIGLMLATGVAAAAVFLAEEIDTSFHSVDDLRAFTRVPVLVSIPRIVTGGDAGRRRWRFWMGATAVMLSLGLIVATTYYVAHDNEQLVRTLARGRS